MILPVERASYDKLNGTALYGQNHAVAAPLSAGCQTPARRLADFRHRQNLNGFPDGVKSQGYYASRQLNHAFMLHDITIV